MRTWDLIDHESVPDDDGTLYLMERGGEYAIHVDGRELMTSKLHGSEDALADFACDLLPELDHARILVGGLGMGFTLGATLRRLGPEAHVTVAELMPAVIRWNRDMPEISRVAGHPLRDPRVAVFMGDVGDLVDNRSSAWSAILLDVDNGPGHLTRPTNGWLYSKAGVRAAWNALHPGGVLAIWSAVTDDDLSGLLMQAGFDVELIFYQEEGRPTPDDSGTQYVWTAQRPLGDQ